MMRDSRWHNEHLRSRAGYFARFSSSQQLSSPPPAAPQPADRRLMSPDVTNAASISGQSIPRGLELQGTTVRSFQAAPYAPKSGAALGHAQHSIPPNSTPLRSMLSQTASSWISSGQPTPDDMVSVGSRPRAGLGRRPRKGAVPPSNMRVTSSAGAGRPM